MKLTRTSSRHLCDPHDQEYAASAAECRDFVTALLQRLHGLTGSRWWTVSPAWVRRVAGLSISS